MNGSDGTRLDDTQPSATRRGTQPAAASDEHRQRLELARREPSDPEAWIGLAAASSDIHEKIEALNQALAIDPGSIRARQDLHNCMTQLLTRDPRLEYRGETSSAYWLRTAEQFEFMHPKDRTPSEPAGSVQNAPHRIYGWLKWALIGLIPAGLGTLFFGPLATLGAVMSLRQPMVEGDRRRLWVAAVLGAGLWLLALVPLILLLLHII